MFIAFGRLCLIVSFIIPKAVEFSILKVVAVFLCPDSINVTLSGAPLCSCLKHSPTSYSTDDATTLLMTSDTLRIEPLRLSSSGVLYPQ